MTKKCLLSLLSLVALFSCSTDRPEIRSAAELTNNGSYVIKWETFPPVKGKVHIYASSSSDLSGATPAAIVENAEQGYTTIPGIQESIRTYYKLVFEDKYISYASQRVIPMEQVFNFRDLGGYNNKDNKQLRWGKIYRSSSVVRANRQDWNTIEQLGINTAVDLRAELISPVNADDYPIERIYNLPFRGNRYNVFFDQILAGKMQRADIIKYLQEVFYFFSDHNTDYLIDMFNILLDESNYPLVIYCSLGKDRSAMVSAIILAALGVNENAIIDDYLLSNDLIDYHVLAENASEFRPDVQESITALFSAHRETIAYTFDQIKANYGSVDNYLETELKLTPDKRNKLKEILLYP